MSSLERVFTGIVRERGIVVSSDGGDEGVRLVIEAPTTSGVTALGDSVSVDGVDLTATAIADGHLTFVAVPETLRRSTLGRLAPGVEVNLEPALRAGEPLGGHYVQGHVDGVCRVRSTERDGEKPSRHVRSSPEPPPLRRRERLRRRPGCRAHRHPRGRRDVRRRARSRSRSPRRRSARSPLATS